MEAIMSSPIHHPKDLDAALMYAPPWAREEGQLPPAPTLPAPRPNRPVEEDPQGFSGDRAMSRLRRQLALHPDKVPEPPEDAARGVLPIVLRFCGVGGAAALVAWAMVSIPGTHQAVEPTVPATFSPPQTARAKDPGRTVTARTQPLEQVATTGEPPRQIAPRPADLAPSPPPPSVPQSQTGQARAAAPAAVAATSAAAPAAAATPPTAAMPAPAPAAAPAAAANAAVRLDSEEIETLVKRGKDFLANGDLASARLLLRRAAEAGSAAAALALGATFDPLVIARLGAIGAAPDVAKARRWYEKAAELGSDAAAQQLAKLTQSGQ
jgi:hypothetical protein